jgi:hypothetical protein
MKLKYTNMHCFCSGNGGAAVVVYWQCYPHLQNSTLENSWNHMHNSEVDWFLLTSECGRWTTTVEKMMFWQQCVKLKYKYTWSFQDNWYSRDMSIENFAPWWFLSVSPVPTMWFCECLQPWLQVLPDILFMDEAQFTCSGITTARSMQT